MSQRALKIRLYPSENEQEFLNAQFGAVRFVYNKALFLHKHLYKYHGLKLKSNKDIKPLLAIAKKSKKYSWMKEYDSLSLQQSIRNLNTAFSNFFSGRARFPQFKKRNHRQSSYHSGSGINVDFDNNTIKIPKIGEIQAKIHRKMEGRLISITVSKSSSGKYFASLVFEQDEIKKTIPSVFDSSKILGIDLGLKHFIIDSNFKKVENPHFLLNAEKNLKRKQKQLSRKIKGSKNRAKARLLIAKIHEKIVNKRMDFFYKLAKQIVDENQAIVANHNTHQRIKSKEISKNVYLYEETKDLYYIRDYGVYFKDGKTNEVRCIFKPTTCSIDFSKDERLSIWLKFLKYDNFSHLIYNEKYIFDEYNNVDDIKDYIKLNFGI